MTLTGRRASRIRGAEDMIGKAFETVASPRFQVVCVVTCNCVDIGCVVTEIEEVNDQKRMKNASHAYKILSILIGVFRSSSFCFFKIYSSSFGRNLRIICLSKYAGPNWAGTYGGFLKALRLYDSIFLLKGSQWRLSWLRPTAGSLRSHCSTMRLMSKLRWRFYLERKCFWTRLRRGLGWFLTGSSVISSHWGQRLIVDYHLDLSAPPTTRGLGGLKGDG
jgi:hypothetical protein